MFLGWYDPDKKRLPADKLVAAIARYRAKHEDVPRVALVNPGEYEAIMTQRWALDVRANQHIAPNTYFVGVDDVVE